MCHLQISFYKYPIICELVHGEKFFKVALCYRCILSNPEIIGIKYQFIMSFDIEYFLQHWIQDNRDEVARNQNVVYRTRSLFATDERYVYFFSDLPHLVKTARNCLYNSGSGKCTRYMWNSGFHLLWSHISNFYNENLNYGLKLVPKLTYEHISLSPYSVMNVREPQVAEKVILHSL